MKFSTFWISGNHTTLPSVDVVVVGVPDGIVPHPERMVALPAECLRLPWILQQQRVHVKRIGKKHDPVAHEEQIERADFAMKMPQLKRMRMTMRRKRQEAKNREEGHKESE